MKIYVDELPAKCGECYSCLDAVMQTQLGIEKKICLCNSFMVLVPQNPMQEPPTIDPEKTPEENNCIFKVFGKNSENNSEKPLTNTTKSGIILSK